MEKRSKTDLEKYEMISTEKALEKYKRAPVFMETIKSKAGLIKSVSRFNKHLFFNYDE